MYSQGASYPYPGFSKGPTAWVYTYKSTKKKHSRGTENRLLGDRYKGHSFPDSNITSLEHSRTWSTQGSAQYNGTTLRYQPILMNFMNLIHSK